MREARLFHLSSLIDVNDCALDFMYLEEDKKRYINVFYPSFIREAVDIDDSII